MWQLHEYADKGSAIDALTEQLATMLRAAIDKRGKVSVAVSGGSTPVPLYAQLARCPLNWSAVTVSLADERWVAELHADSNARMIRQHLLQQQARRAAFVGMKTHATDAFKAVPALHNILARHIMPLELVLLGMGLDGHTASLFPHAEGLDYAMAEDCPTLCCAIQPLTTPGAGESCTRMTLSLRTLLTARHRVLFITGKRKREVLDEALTPGLASAMPVRALLHDRDTMTEIYYAPDD